MAKKHARTQMRLSQLTGSLHAGGAAGAGKIRADVAADSLSDYAFLDLSGSLSAMLSGIARIHGRTGDEALNNAAGTFYTAVVPDSDGGQNLGSSGAEWGELHVNRIDSAAALDVNITTGLTLDATTMSIDGTDDSNLTVTGAGKDLDLAVAGGGAQELRLASAGTGASAIHLNASAGGINVDSADMIDIDAADEITIDTTSADGHIALTSAHTGGQSILISANADAGSILDIDAGIIDIDVQDAITIDAADEIVVTTTSADGHISLVSAHTAGVAVHIDADADAGSIVDIDAGILDVDVTAGVDIAAGAASAIATSAGDLTLNASAARVVVSGSSGADSLLVQSAAQFSSDVVVAGNLTVQGTTATVDTTNLLVKDKNIIINDGGGAASAAGAGLDIEENGSITGYIRVADDDRGNFDFKAPDGSELKLDINAQKTFTIAGDLGVEADSAINQDVTTDASPSFAHVKTQGIQPLAAGGELHITGSSTTGNTTISMVDNLASALDIGEGSNSYMRFTTTDNQEAITVSKFFSIADDIPISFGAAAGDFRLFYDEASTDKLVLSASVNGATKAFLLGNGHSVDLEFGDANTKIARPSAGNLDIAASGRVEFMTDYLQLGNGNDNAGAIRLLEDGNNGTHYINLKAPESLAGNVTFELPANNGTSGYILQSNGSGVTSWVENAGSAAKMIFSGSAGAAVAAGADVASGTGLSVFTMDLHSSITDSNLNDAMCVFVNGQLLYSGSETNRAAGTADYTVSGSGNDYKLKLAFDLEIDDMVQVVVR